MLGKEIDSEKRRLECRSGWLVGPGTIAVLSRAMVGAGLSMHIVRVAVTLSTLTNR